MHSLFPVACALLGLTALLPAQLSGNYIIDPAGGPGIYATFQDAVNAAVTSGVSGPVTFVANPGTYTESVSIVTIPGASAANTVTFRALVPGLVHLVGATTHTFSFSGVTTARAGWVVFDGLDFMSAPGCAIFATSFTDGCEVRNCTFGPNHRPATGSRDALIEVTGGSTDVGWNIHHNKFTFPNRVSRTAYGVYLQTCGGFAFHHNTFDLNGCNYGLYLINQNRRLDTVYNNIFFGTLAGATSATSAAAIKADVSNYDNDFAHNSFYVTITGPQGCIIASQGLGGTTPATNRIRNNVFHLTGVGTCIVQGVDATTQAIRPFVSDGNVFHAPNGEIGRVGGTGAGITTLAAWQTASGQDAASVQADPLYRNVVANPPDLRFQPGSPAQGLAVLTPAYVTDDFLGRLRDSLPDAGAFEGSSFATYGAGCPGTGSLVPAISCTGTVALGSPVSIGLSNAVASSIAVSIGGFSRTMYGVMPLPFALGGGCFVLASPDATTFAVTSGAGTASQAVSIPSNVNLLGLDVFWQWAVLDAASPSPFGIVTSNGGALQL